MQNTYYHDHAKTFLASLLKIDGKTSSSYENFPEFPMATETKEKKKNFCLYSHRLSLLFLRFERLSNKRCWLYVSHIDLVKIRKKCHPLLSSISNIQKKGFVQLAKIKITLTPLIFFEIIISVIGFILQSSPQFIVWKLAFLELKNQLYLRTN